MEKHILNNIISFTLISLFTISNNFSFELEIFDQNLIVPIEYKRGKDIKKRVVYERKNYAFTYLPDETRTVDCKVQFLCDDSEKVKMFTEMNQKYEIQEKFSCKNSDALLWRLTDTKNGDKSFIATFYSKNQIITIYDDIELWREWLTPLQCTKSST